MKKDTDLLLKRYKRLGKKVVIEVELETAEGLFERKDPSPLKGRDLNESVVEYIFDSVSEIPHPQSIEVHLYFLNFNNRLFNEEKISSAFRNYFVYEVERTLFDLRNKIIRGVKALVIGCLFLFLCVFITHKAPSHSSLFTSFFKEGLTVLGWVSLWYPIQIFLYEWWPIWEDKRLCAKIADAQLKVFVRRHEGIAEVSASL